MLRRVFFVLLLPLGLTGCIHYHYASNMVMTPFIDKKNESTLGIALGGGQFASVVNAQAAYNPAKRITLAAGYFRYYDRFEPSRFDDEMGPQLCKLQYLEAAGGGWLNFEDERLRVGCLLGAGIGQAYNDFGFGGITNLHYKKAYLQPTFVFKGKVFRFGMASRLCYLGYGKGMINTGIPSDELQSLVNIEADGPFFLTETGMNVGVKAKAVTISFNFAGGQVQGKNREVDYGFDLFSMSTGLTFNLQQLFGKQSGN